MAKTLTETAAVVRYGQSFYVVAFAERFTGRSITEDDAERLSVARFAFVGPCVKSNADAMRAMVEAKMAATKTVR